MEVSLDQCQKISLLKMGGRMTNCWVIICEGVVYFHISEEPSDMLVKKALYLLKVELRVNKDCTNIRLDNIRKGLNVKIHQWASLSFRCEVHTFGGCLVFIQ